MYRISAFHIQRLHSVNRLTDDIHHASFDLFASRHQYRMPCRQYFQSSLKTVSIIHGDTPHSIFSDVLLHFNDEFTSIRTLHHKCIINFRQHFLRINPVCVKGHVNDRTDNLGNMSFNLFHID